MTISLLLVLFVFITCFSVLRRLKKFTGISLSHTDLVFTRIRTQGGTINSNSMYFSELSVGSTRDAEDTQTHVCVAQGGHHLFLQKQTLPLSFNDNLSIFKES